MNDRRIVLAQARTAIVVALRTPRALVFTFLFPLIFLVLFNSIFIKGGDQTVTLPTDLKLSAQAYFMAGITAYSIALSTFTTLAVSITTQRERGQLKRLRGTPMPSWTFIVAQILRATAQALAMTVLLVAIGVLAYGVEFPGSSFLGFLVYVALGTATLCTLGIALTRLHPHRRRRLDDRPLQRRHPRLLLRRLDPDRPASPLAARRSAASSPSTTSAIGLQSTLSPEASGTGLEASNVTPLLVWALIGTFIATRRFRWEPQAGTT